MQHEKKIEINFLKISIFLILLLQVNFFDLIPSTPFVFYYVNSYSVKNATLIVVLLLLPMLFKYRGHLYGSFTFSTILLLIFTLYIAFNSMTTYTQGFTETFKLYGYIFIIFIYWELRHVILTTDVFRFFLKTTIALGTINAAIQSFNSFVVMHFGKNLLFQSSNVDADNIIQKAKVVSGFVRVQTPADFIYFSLLALFTFVIFFKGELVASKIYSIYFVISFYIIFVSQTRVYELLLAIITIIFITIRWRELLKKWFVLAIPAVAGIFVVGIFIVFQKLSFTSGDRVASLNVRIEAINYYLSHAKDNGIFGIGFASDNQYFLLNHGYSQTFQKSAYYFDDVGVVGFLGKYGFLGYVYLLFLLIDLIKNLVFSKEKLYSIVVIFSLLITSVSLIYLDPQRILFLPLTFLLLTYASNYKIEE